MHARPTSIAIMALGGQGGGLLAEWIIEAAERSGYVAQGTSVPGVAQRTGATIYYIEIFPGAEIKAAGREPVLALMPVAGDVDIVIAAELMEAGRAMMRGLVTADRTTLIASSHRIYAIAEKSALGDGRASSAEVIRAASSSAKAFIHFDMEALALEAGGVISAVLCGALAASGALPIPRAAYEGVIRQGGLAVDINLAAFAAGFDGAQRRDRPAASSPAPVAPNPASLEMWPSEVRDMVHEGLKRVVDYQGAKYGALYLDRLTKIFAVDRDSEGARHGWALTREAARHLALWMTYEDVIRVADLKTRASRFRRVHEEVGAAPDQIVYFSEFMHPRIEEVCDMMPAAMGRFVLARPWLKNALGRFFSRGRRISTARIGGFLLLYALAGLRPLRPVSLRFKIETQRIAAWLTRITEAAALDYDLAVEIIACQRLIKGYGDTHARGMRNFERLMAAYPAFQDRTDAAVQLRRLRDAALADEEGARLDQELVAMAS